MSKVAYECDRRKCANCSFPVCRHTEDIEHAEHFIKAGSVYIEDAVKHGHWNSVSREYVTGEGADMYAQCSECGEIELVYTRHYVQRYKFCPHCGAKMDGEEKEE